MEHVIGAGSGAASIRHIIETLPHLLPHFNALPSSSPPSVFILNRAIEALASRGLLSRAQDLFDQMPHRNGGSWHALVSSFSRCNLPIRAVSLFSSMHREGIRPKDVTLASVLGSCSEILDLSITRQIHTLVFKLGFSSNVIINTSFVDIYGKCNFISDAEKVFDSMPNPNEVSWNVIIRRYYELGRGENALKALSQMIKIGVKPLNFTLSNALLASSDICALIEGKQIHGYIIKVGHDCNLNTVVKNSILQMYARCGALDEAYKLFGQSKRRDVFMWTLMVLGYAKCGRTRDAEEMFDEMPERNVVSWNAMLGGYVKCSAWDKALNFFKRMQSEIDGFDIYTLGAVLKVCGGLLDLEKGKQIHGFIYRHKLHLDSYLSNALISMYAKCGCLRNMEILFFKILENKDTISWNCLISGYERHCRSEDALFALKFMLLEANPNESTFCLALSACANIFSLEFGKQIHAYILRNGYEIDDITRDALVSMYSKCRLINYSINVFEERETRDVILWNSMILGCAYNGKGEYALDLFEEMRKREINADNVTFIGLFLACICEGYVDLGKGYFSLMSEEFGIMPRVEHYECMIELFGKHGYMVELEDFVEKMVFEPTGPMWMRIFDSSREFGYSKLGKKAENFINASNPLNPVKFELSE